MLGDQAVALLALAQALARLGHAQGLAVDDIADAGGVGERAEEAQQGDAAAGERPVAEAREQDAGEHAGAARRQRDAEARQAAVDDGVERRAEGERIGDPDREFQHRDPDAEQEGVDVEVLELGGALPARVRRAQVGEVRIDEEMQRGENPDRQAEAALPGVQRRPPGSTRGRPPSGRVDGPYLRSTAWPFEPIGSALGRPPRVVRVCKIPPWPVCWIP